MNVNESFELVSRALRTGRLAHGYLIVGPIRGLAMDLAVKILQALFCKVDGGPCGGCEGCRRVAERIEADVHWIYPEKKSRVISVQQIREQLLSEISQTSLSGGWKAGVLVGADRLNDASANAFLKTLEEPPDKTVFLLLSDAPQQLLRTIVSRCQRIDLDDARELAEPWMSRVVETLASPRYGTPLERLAMANMLFSVLADMKGKAQQLVVEESVDESKVDEDEEVFDARVSARYREMRADFVLALLRWFRDLLALKAGGGDAPVYTRTKLDELRARAERLTLAQALYNVTVVEELGRQLERNLPEETLLAVALDRIFHGVPTG